MKQAKAQKLQSYLQLLLVAAIIVAINIIAQFVHERLDLTSDNRYSLGEPTIEMLGNMEDIAYVKVYLQGEGLPPGFRHLRDATREMLEEFKAYASEKLEYQFIDPGAIKNPKEKRAFYRELSKKGLNPVNLTVKGENRRSQKLIFPGAVIHYRNQSLPVRLLNQQMGQPPQQVIHNSVLGLEYKFVSVIQKLQSTQKPRIAFITGHKELSGKQTEDIRNELAKYYHVEEIRLPKYQVGILRKFDLVVIPKPASTFTELDKYKIDQYIMRGGKVLWLVESLAAEKDSLRNTGTIMSYEYQLNLRDQLFKYGVRINQNLVQDMQSHMIPVLSNLRGNQSRRNFLPWPYDPLVVPRNEHPVTNNLNPIWLRFANTIDTVGTKGIRKTFLLKTSPYSRVQYHPVRITLHHIRDKLKKRLFNTAPQPVAVLLEGKFPSVFQHRIAPASLKTEKYGDLKPISEPTRMIVISDGDVIRNQYHQIKDKVYPLGYDYKTNQHFSNKKFILNCVDYLLDQAELLQLRTKDYQVHLLDQGKIKRSKNQWQVMNMAIPVLFVIIFGVAYNILRITRYGKKAAS